MSKKIMLMCSGGMSTSLLVNRMKKVAADQNIDVEIFATGSADAQSVVNDHQPDVLLLGPQIKFMFSDLSRNLDIPVGVISNVDYGMMDGEKVLKQAQSLLE